MVSSLLVTGQVGVRVPLKVLRLRDDRDISVLVEQEDVVCGGMWCVVCGGMWCVVCGGVWYVVVCGVWWCVWCVVCGGVWYVVCKRSQS